MNQKTEKPPVDTELRRRVQELIAFKGGGHNEDAVADIIENALKILTDVKDTGDVRVIQTAVRELRYAYRLFAPYAQTRKVTMFGSARTAPSKQEYQQAVEFGQKIVQAGFMVITGAGPGIMQAGHEGPGRKTASASTSACRGNKAPIRSSARTRSSSPSNTSSPASSSSSGTRTPSCCFPAASERWTKATKPSR